MGLRYRKSINFGPLRLNFSKSGIGYSYGVKGYRVTHTADGKVRTTMSVPGTGISHVTERPAAASRPKPRKKAESGMPFGVKLALLGLVLFFVFIGIAGCSADEPEPVHQMTVQEALELVEGKLDKTEPTPTQPTTEPTPEVDPEPAQKPAATEPKTEAPTEPKTEAPTQPATEPEPEPVTEPEPAPKSVAYIGNKSSKKLHKTWCSSVEAMSEKNKVEFYSREEAIYQNYDPCKKCTP